MEILLIRNIALILITSMTLMAGTDWTDEIAVPMTTATATGTGQALGTITVVDTPYGALFTPQIDPYGYKYPYRLRILEDGKQLSGTMTEIISSRDTLMILRRR